MTKNTGIQGERTDENCSTGDKILTCGQGSLTYIKDCQLRDTLIIEYYQHLRLVQPYD